MWLWLSIAALLSTDPAWSAPSPLPLTSEAQGPRSEEESRLLWKDGSKAFAESRWSEAARLLHRLVERYPAHPRALQSQVMLGRSLLRAGRPGESLQPLRHFIEARGTAADSHRARLILAEAYLQLDRAAEARAVALEIWQAEGQGGVAPEISAAARLLEAQACVAQGLLAQAESLLAAARKHLPPDSAGLRALAERTALQVRQARCAELPGTSADRLDEAQFSDALNRRGDCLAEALPHLKSVLQIDTPEARERGDWSLAARLGEAAYAGYHRACAEPPAPTGKRTARERQSYLFELKNLLSRTCGEALRRNLALLDSWKNDIPSRARPELARIRAACEAAGRF